MEKTSRLTNSGLLFSLGLILLAIVDFRRGFLFNKADYVAKTPFFVFSPLQLILIVAGLAGAYYFKSSLKKADNKSANFTLLGIFLLLLIDVGLYRGVAASRALDAGKVGIDWLAAFGATGLIKPIALGTSYILTVWHATVLSCLGAGLALIALPRFANGPQKSPGWRGTLGGTLYSVTQPFCSCCVAMTSPGLFRKKQSMNFALAVLLGAPLLNISTLILAGSLLPLPFALLRIVGGVAITLALSYILSKWILGETAVESEDSKFQAEAIAKNDSPSEVLENWLKLSGKIALILIPSMIVGTLLSSLAWSLWPQDMGNSVTSVALTSVLGSLVMVSTWSEIPLATQMIQNGMTGPAAAALVALPAVNLGSLVIVSQISRNWKVAVSLGLGIMALSAAAGLAFL